MKFKIIFILGILLFFWENSIAESIAKEKILNKSVFFESIEFKKIEFNTCLVATSSNKKELSELFFHHDSIHRFNFRFKDKKRGIKPFIAPTLLLATGTALHFSTDVKENFQDWVQYNFAYSGSIDDYLQYVPGAAVYALNLFGIKGKNNFGNRTAIVIKSLLINDLLVSNLKSWVDSKRPNGEPRSFPSGHTSTAFVLAQFMHHEFGDRSIWYSIGAYSCATTVGLMRVTKDAHWISDVIAGAGFGMLSTELIYLTHLYKWDNEHIKKLDIFPWRKKQQTGLTMVYSF